MDSLTILALAIAFWRNALAVGVLAPVALTRRRAELIGLAFDVRLTRLRQRHLAGEVPGAALLGWAWLHQTPAWAGLTASAGPGAVGRVRPAGRSGRRRPPGSAP